MPDTNYDGSGGLEAVDINGLKDKPDQHDDVDDIDFANYKGIYA